MVVMTTSHLSTRRLSSEAESVPLLEKHIDVDLYVHRDVYPAILLRISFSRAGGASSRSYNYNIVVNQQVGPNDKKD